LLPSLFARAEDSFLRQGEEILTVGDSITAQGVYQNYMQRVLDTLYPDAGIKIVNVGVGGMRADGGVGVLTDTLKKRKPTLITVMFGVNDTHWTPTDAEAKAQAYTKHLTPILEIAREHGIPLILLRETHFTHNAMAELWVSQINATLEHLLRAEDALAAEKHVPVIDVLSAYREALDAAWSKDVRYEFTPDVIHPTQPGQAAMAAEILRALGAGLPLAAGERGPLHLVRGAAVRLEGLDGVGIAPVAPSGPLVDLKIRCRNVLERAVKGEVTIVAAGHKASHSAHIPGYGQQTLAFDLPVAAFKDRWGCLPIYILFKGDSLFTAGHAFLWHSRLIPANEKPFDIAAKDFRVANRGTAPPCPVSRAAVRLGREATTIEFTWKDEKTVLAQSGFKNILHQVIPTPLDLAARDGQPCDAVEFCFDLRPDESAARCTSNADTNPDGVLRLGVYKAKEGDRIVAKILRPEGVTEAEATLAAKGDDRYVLTFKRPSQGSSLGFSMRVTDADSFGLNNGPIYVLTGRPQVSFEPMSYLRLTAGQPGVFWRVGY
jgi:lysophospholipase L1-like esterase